MVDPQCADKFCECDICGQDIYIGEPYYNFGDRKAICIDCVDDAKETAGEWE